MNIINADELCARLSPDQATAARLYQVNARNLDSYGRRQLEQGATDTALKCFKEADTCRKLVEDILLGATTMVSIPFRGKVS
ncbi:hypothetical protein [Komagataeibacter xylinus]|uniref:Uncharacterized protein n=1 Tax=Komagataeibacter xylinus TaxID=28448 RepID=A0A857FQ48_KOMXY|nr:hypothetical protein [Komagataeibacter xylinus]QHC36438.1 hypothetical protein FMA36_13860 [Komagataeibacter xylinus]